MRPPECRCRFCCPPGMLSMLQAGELTPPALAELALPLARLDHDARRAETTIMQRMHQAINGSAGRTSKPCRGPDMSPLCH